MMWSATGSLPRRLAGSSLLAVLLAACSSAPVDTGPERHPASAREPVATTDAVASLCDDDAVSCIRLSSTRVAVAYLSRRAQRGGTSAGTVVWNPGGPGLTPPPPSVRERGLPRALRPFDVLYFVEPWVLDPPGEECLGRGATDASACHDDSLVWSTSEMQEAIDVAVGTNGAPVVGVYGTSYGATANAELVPGVVSDGGWAILENPAPPAGTPLGHILRARAQAMVGLVAGWGGCRAGQACHALRSGQLDTWGRRGVGRLDPGQSALGLAALTTDPGSNATFLDQLTRRLDEGRTPSAVQLRALRRAGDRFTLRGPEPGSVQASLVGLWAGTCRSFGEPGMGLRGLAAGLAEVYTGCRGLQADEPPAIEMSERILLLHGQDDAVVPTRLQRTWREIYPRATSQTIPGSGHFRDDDRVDAAMSSWLDAMGTGS